MVTVVGYWTRGTAYAEEAKLLEASLNRVGVEHRLIVSVPDRGDWDANTARKPVALRRWRELLGGPLLYVDVDAFFHADPTDYLARYTQERYDFGIHYFRGPAFGHDRSKVRAEGWWPLTGTLYIGDTDGARRILDRWIKENESRANKGDHSGGGQRNLQTILPWLEDQHRIARLPGRLCYCYDKPWAYDPDEPVWIEHTIASREHRGRRIESLVRSRNARKRELWKLVQQEETP